MKKQWYETIKFRQEKLREKNLKSKEQKIKPASQRNAYRWGAKDYLSSFQVGEAKQYNGDYSWESLKSIASNLKKLYGVQYVFNTVGLKRYISRVL